MLHFDISMTSVGLVKSLDVANVSKWSLVSTPYRLSKVKTKSVSKILVGQGGRLTSSIARGSDCV